MEIRIDLQTHTRHSSSCGWMAPERLVDVASRFLNAVAVTDHNTMDGVDAAIAAAPDDFLVIPGEEVDTPTGQVIGLFLESEITPEQPATDVFEEIHAQSGLAFVPHPFDAFRGGLTDIETYVDVLDGVEVLNSRCVRDSFNEQAASFAADHDLATFGGSDAHFANEVGNSYTIVDIDSKPSHNGIVEPDDLRTALEKGRARAAGRRGSLLNHVGTKAVKFYRSLG